MSNKGPAAGSRWKVVAKESKAEFHAKKLAFIGVRGEMPVLSGELDMTAGSLEGTVDPTQLKTPNPTRDSDLKSAGFLDVEKHPQIRFAALSVKERDGQWDLIGDLEVRGVKKPVTFRTDTVEFDDARGHAVARAVVNRHDFEVSKMRYIVNADIELVLDIRLERAT